MKQILRERGPAADRRVPAERRARGDQPGQERDARPDVPRRQRGQPPRTDSSRELATRYQERLKRAAALDFDDLLLEAVRLFDEAPAVPGQVPGALALPPRRRVPGHEPGAVPVGPGARRRSTATSPSSATTTSRSTPGAARTCATSSTSSATGRRPRWSSWSSNYRSTQLILDAAHAVVSRNDGAQGQEALDRHRRRREDPALRGRTTRRRRPSGSPARSRAWSAAAARRLDPARRTTTSADQRVPRAGHRGHVPDERPVPGDRGVVPALRHPLPARRRDPVLRPARGQGRARLPAHPAQRHRQRQLRADHQRARPAPSATRPSRSCAPPRRPRDPETGEPSTTWAAIERAARGEVEGLAPRTRNALAEFAALVRRLRARVGRAAACPSCSTRSSRRRATGRCWPTARRTARSAGPTCSSCARSRPATTT